MWSYKPRYSYLTIRLDDICPTMNYHRFYEIKEILDRYDVKPCIGVIPNNQDPNLHIDGQHADFWETIRELAASGWVIAQHGYNHVYSTKQRGLFSLNAYSEFAGVPYSQQLRKLTEGVEIFKSNGLHSDVFMAPAHSLDNDTVHALRETGFRFVTDGLSSDPYCYRGLYFLPCMHWGPVLPKGIATWCIHPNTISESGLIKLDIFLQKHRDIVIDFSDALKVPPQNLISARLQERWNFLLLGYAKPFLSLAYHALLRVSKR